MVTIGGEGGGGFCATEESNEYHTVTALCAGEFNTRAESNLATQGKIRLWFMFFWF